MARLELFARTEVGCVRERNEDAFLVANLQTGHKGLGEGERIQELMAAGGLIGVCDGMGGAAAGDLAAQMATDCLFDVVSRSIPFRDASGVQAALLQACVSANRTIADHARVHAEKRGMGTTMTAAIAFATDLYIVHIGDSRAYLRRGRALQQLTNDHSVVGQMIATGQLTREQARNYEHRNVLLQALGVQQVISPEIVIVPLFAGDVLLLCSDGLTGPLPDEQVLDLMLKHADPMRCCRALTEAACAAGGPDNVTVAVARFVGEGLPIAQGRAPIDFRRANHTIQ